MRVGDEGVEVGEGGGMANADIEVTEKRRRGGREGRAARSVKLLRVAKYSTRYNVIYDVQRTYGLVSDARETE